MLLSNDSFDLYVRTNGLNHVHDVYKVEPMHPACLPIIDISLLQQDCHTKSLIINEIRQACQNFGCFHVINHGISESVIKGALDLNTKFFEMPIEDKKEIMSDDIYKPVRFGTVRNEVSNGQFTRDFLKLYANPLEDWINSWPENPSGYTENMGQYTMEVRRLGIEIFGAIMESLHLSPTYLRSNLEQGVHIMGINNYQPSPESNVVAGNPPHSDHSIITILLQSSPGLHLMDPANGAWKTVPEIKGSLQVFVGNHLEVISNGLYKSVMHRAIPSFKKTRISIASLYSLAEDEIVEPAIELVDEEHQKGYKGSSLMDFFKHLSSKESKTFIETLKIQS